MRRAELLDAQEDGKYGKGNLGSDLPEELRRQQDRLEKIRQARKALEAEAAAADAVAEEQADASEQQMFRNKAAKARKKAESAKDLAIEKAREAGHEPEGLEPQAADAMPHRSAVPR
ncbi:MAG: hypothetical protein WAM11_00025 [Cyanobium sp.]